MCLFALIADKLKFAVGCSEHCTNADNWWKKHSSDSVDEFWGSSFMCFVLGAYTIIGGVYEYNNSEPDK